MISISDLARQVTVDDAKASIYGVLADLGVSTTGWRSGAVARTIVTLCAIILSAASVMMMWLTRSRFRSLATDEWLSLSAEQDYGVDRIPATFATTSLTLTNSGGGLYVLGIGDLVVLNSTTSKTYFNTAAVTINPLATIAVDVQAFEAGTASNAAPTEIDTLVTTLLGVTCSNAAAAVATNVETDAELRARCDSKLDSLSPNGPAGAYDWVARTTLRADGSLISVTRTKASADATDGTVDFYVADADGPIAAGDLTLVDAAIQEQVVPLAVTATVANASAKSIAVTCEVWYWSTLGLTTTEVEAGITAYLTAWMASQPIGGNVIAPASGYVFVDAIRGEIAKSYSDIFHAEVTVPAADVAIAVSEAPVIGAVSVTAHVVTP